MSDPTKLELLEDTLDDLTAGQEDTLKAYMLGALSQLVDVDTWVQALGIAGSCARAEGPYRAAVGA